MPRNIVINVVGKSHAKSTPKGAFDKLSHNSPSVLGIVFFDGYIGAYIIVQEIFRVEAKCAVGIHKAYSKVAVR